MSKASVLVGVGDTEQANIIFVWCGMTSTDKRARTHSSLGGVVEKRQPAIKAERIAASGDIDGVWGGKPYGE